MSITRQTDTLNERVPLKLIKKYGNLKMRANINNIVCIRIYLFICY